MPEVLVAVVSWNTRDLLARCLESLAGDERLEVHVVDNASTDGSAGMVRERFPWVTLHALEENLGFGRAVNLAVERGSRTAHVAPANADVALEPGALDALLAAGAAVAAPRLILPDGRTQPSVLPFPTLRFTVAFNLGLARARPEWALGAFLLVRRDAWDAVGGFDEAQWMYAEDLDLGWRLARAGFPTRHVPEARVRHESGAATRQAFGDAVTETWQVATYAWLRRRRGRARTAAIALVNVAGATARAAVRPRAERDVWRGWARTHLTGWRRSGPAAAAPARARRRSR